MSALTTMVPNLVDKTNIPTVMCIPPGASDLFVMVHGLTTSKDEYLDFYKSIADDLARKGVASVRFDCRAHGESLAPATEFNVVNNVADAISVVNHVLKERSFDRIHLFGTSFGALTVSIYANLAREQIASVTLLAPVLDTNALYLDPVPERASYKDFRGTILHGGSPRDLDGRVSLDLKNAIEFSAINMSDIVQSFCDRLTVIHGKADSIVPYSVTANAIKDLTVKSFVAVEGMDHGFTDISDEAGTGPKSAENYNRILQLLISAGVS